MADAPDPDQYATHRADVRNGVALAYVREGTGGVPLLVLHGYPETKRIWWRNIRPLAAAGLPPDDVRERRATADDVAFHVEPDADARKLRASWGVYEQTTGRRPMENVPRLFEPTPVPTLVLYGPEDHVVLPSFPWKAAAACLDCTGPLFVPNAGHFLQWEAADTFNKITTAFCQPPARAPGPP